MKHCWGGRRAILVGCLLIQTSLVSVDGHLAKCELIPIEDRNTVDVLFLGD